MKISKSFKIYIHIILIVLISKNLFANEDFSKNIVIYEKPKIIEQLKFKDLNLQDVDLSNKKGNIMILNFGQLGAHHVEEKCHLSKDSHINTLK